MVEVLKSLFGDAVTDEALKTFNEELGKKFVAKSDYNGKLEEINGLNAQILDRDKQLKTLKDSAGTSEELKKQIEQLQADNKAAKESYDKQIGELKFNSALESALLKSGAVDSDLVKVKLNRDGLTLKEDGTLSGLEEQLKTVKENYGFLFEEKGAAKPQFAAPAQNAKTNDMDAARVVMGLPPAK